MPPALFIAAYFIAIASAAIALAALLRAAPTPGGERVAAIIAGATIAIILGPSVAPRTAPALQQVFTPTTPQARALADFNSSTQRERAALNAAGVSQAAIEEHQQAAEQHRISLAAAAINAQAQHTQTLLAAPAAAALILILAATPTLLPRTRTARARLIKAPTLLAAIPITLAHIAVATTAAILANLAFNLTIPQSLAIAAVFAAPTVNAALRPNVLLAALLTTIILAAAILIAAPRTSPLLIPAIIAFTLPLLLPLSSRNAARIARSIINTVLLPALTALLLCTIDLHALHLSLPQLITAATLALIVSSDARWFTAWLALRATKARSPATTASTTLDNATPLTQLAVCALLAAPLFIPPAIILAAAAGALTIEASKPIRSTLSALLDNKSHPGS